MHEHRFVDGEGAVVHRHHPVARLDHRARDRGEAGLVLVPEGHRREPDRQRRQRRDDDGDQGVPRGVPGRTAHRGRTGVFHAKGGSGRVGGAESRTGPMT
ncbi:MAG: hypothetical protein ACK55I_22715, partial [bacterium]